MKERTWGFNVATNLHNGLNTPPFKSQLNNLCLDLIMSGINTNEISIILIEMFHLMRVTIAKPLHFFCGIPRALFSKDGHTRNKQNSWGILSRFDDLSLKTPLLYLISAF